MATWNRLVSGSTAGNASLNIDYAIASVTRTSNTNVRVVYGIRFSMATSTYTYNSIAAFCPKGGSRYYAFNSGSGASHTSSGTYYYANTSGSTTTSEKTPFTIDIPVTLTQTSASFEVGYGWNGWTPTQQGSSSISVTFPTGATAPTGLECSVTARTETTVTLSGKYGSDGGASVTASGYQYSTNGTSWTNCTNSVTGLSPNTTYYFRYYATNSVGTSYSSNTSITTYAYPYLTSVPTFTVGNSLTIGIYNPLGRSCVISVIGDNGTEYTGGTITGTSISGFNNNTWLNNWYATLPSKTSGTYKARLKCTTGNINQLSSGSTYSLDTSDTNFKPTFAVSNLTSVSNSLYTDINGTDKFIKNHNSLSGIITPMTANRSASGSYYNISASGLTTVKKNYSSSNISFTLGNMSTNTFNVTAVDSRGFSTTASKTITLIDYSNPSVTSAKITRQNGIGTKAILAFSGKYTNWSGLLKTNSIQSIKYKINSGSWKSLPSNATLTNSNGTWILNATLDDTFAVTSTYSLYLQITDLLETITTNAYTVSTADALVWKDLANKRLGIGKKPDYTLDVEGLINSTDGIRVGSNENITLRSITPTGGDGNTTGYRLIGQKNIGAWHNSRMSFIITSIHTGNGIFNLAFGCNSSTVSETNIYCQINYFGNTGSGSIVDANSIVAYVKGSTLYFFWRYNDYNTTNILLLTNWGGFVPENGAWVTTIDSNTYGTLKAQTTINKPNIDHTYPVGSIYISATATSPASLFGGTWTQLKNHFLFATNATSGNKGKDAMSSHTGDTTTAATGNTGAASGNTGSTTLTAAQSGLPAHGHNFYYTTDSSGLASGRSVSARTSASNTIQKNGDYEYYSWVQDNTAKNASEGHTHSLNSHTHSLGSHTHTVSYIEVYVWQRTA